MTVNHRVAGSSPATAALFILLSQESYYIYDSQKENKMNGFSRFSGDGLFRSLMASGIAMYLALIVMI
jgi:hypothetical protein|tara:strand:+ start:158 stop:361 length:204 start_codon:yes stop_codon:yes gene_type:complete